MEKKRRWGEGVEELRRRRDVEKGSRKGEEERSLEGEEELRRRGGA